MGRPRNGYYVGNQKVPSVTTVLGSLGWSKSALMHWAWKEGKEDRDYRETRQKAADIGTLAHLLIQNHGTGVGVEIDAETPQDMIDAAFEAYRAFKRWYRENDVAIMQTEQAIVCPRYLFGGTLDAVGQVSGRFCLPDYKTSKAVYPEYVLQVAAYRYLWNTYRAQGELTTVTDAVIVRVSKDGELLTYNLTAEQLDNAFEVFLALLRVHQAKREIEPLVRLEAAAQALTVPAMKAVAS
jgi:hypothetical protein